GGRAALPPGTGDRRTQLRPGTPRSGADAQQPGVTLPEFQPTGRGRSAPSPRSGDHGTASGPRRPERGHGTQQPGAIAPGYGPAGRGRAAEPATTDDLPQFHAQVRS